MFKIPVTLCLISLFIVQACKKDPAQVQAKLQTLSDMQIDQKSNEPVYAEEMKRRILLSLAGPEFEVVKDVHKRFPQTPFEVKADIITSLEAQKVMFQLAEKALQSGCLNSESLVDNFTRLEMNRDLDEAVTSASPLEKYYGLASQLNCPLKVYSPFLAKYFESGIKSKQIPVQLGEAYLNQLFKLNDLSHAKEGPRDYLMQKLSEITKFTVSKEAGRGILYNINLDIYSRPDLDVGMMVAMHSILNPIGSGPLRLYRELKSIRANVYMSGAGTHYKLASVLIDRKALQSIYGNPQGPKAVMDLEAWNRPWQDLSGMAWISWCKRKGIKCSYATMRS